MKKIFVPLAAILFLTFSGQAQILKKIGDKLKNKTEQEANKEPQKDTTVTPTSEPVKKEENSSNNTEPTPAPTLKVYANYDFVPGDTILFEDNFTDDADGEFPSHWNLENGQAILNKFNGIECFYLTDGNYCKVTPLTKTNSYLTDPFTVEFDTYNPDNAAYGLMTFFKTSSGEDIGDVRLTAEAVTCKYFDGKELSGSLPAEIQYDNYKNKWHHIAIAYKKGQIKVYVDQFRVLVVPNSGIIPQNLYFGGIGDPTNPIIFKNIRIAKGGGMNMLGKKFTETKIVTHGINFDIDKATIKPESMGTLNMIVQVMKDNSEIKFEVDGHTDNTGGAAHNLTLSQQRANSVKDQLVKMGIDAARLSTKGFGDTKPISDNTTLEGRANNRRVEFVKM
jgi:outer membrane protein OmpA-like peptidoglycan-associated protein